MSNPSGFVMLNRSPETRELLKNSKCFVLLTQIAMRANRLGDFSIHWLQPGEAYIGDLGELDLSEREYRTAKKNLEKWGFATFRATNRGTIATLTDSRVYDINIENAKNQVDKTLPKNDDRMSTVDNNTTSKMTGMNDVSASVISMPCTVFEKQNDEQNDRQATNERQADDEQATTNNNIRSKYIKKPHPKIFSDESDEMKLSKYFFSLIRMWNEGIKEPNYQSWARHIDLMIRVDKMTADKIRALMDRVQDDDRPVFNWRKNILSPETLRKRWNEGKLYNITERAKIKERSEIEKTEKFLESRIIPEGEKPTVEDFKIFNESIKKLCCIPR